MIHNNTILITIFLQLNIKKNMSQVSFRDSLMFVATKMTVVLEIFYIVSNIKKKTILNDEEKLRFFLVFTTLIVIKID